MKFYVLTGQYPNSESPYRHMFVHTRSRWYLEMGHEVTVLVPSKHQNRYVYEGVTVIEGQVAELTRELDAADVVCFHLLLHRIDKTIDAGPIYDHVLAKKLPTLFFIHGVETQKIWKSRRGDLQWHRPFTIARMMYRDFYLIRRMKETLQQFLESSNTCKFIAPSKWMFDESLDTTGVPVGNNGVVIPNGIDTDLFRFTDRWQDRHKLLVIRPLTTQAKYAVDLFVELGKFLGEKESLHLYGNGSDSEVNRIKEHIAQVGLSTFNLHRQFIENSQIPTLHQRHGIYCAVTRMDAQGVSMCEAMASGLPCVSFDITAIGEFIESGSNGFLARPYDLNAYSSFVNELIEDRNLYSRIAETARKSMEQIDIKVTIQQELDLADSLLRK